MTDEIAALVERLRYMARFLGKRYQPHVNAALEAVATIEKLAGERDAAMARVAVLGKELACNHNTLCETRRRLQRYGKSVHEIEMAIDETAAALTPAATGDA